MIASFEGHLKGTELLLKELARSLHYATSCFRDDLIFG